MTASLPEAAQAVFDRFITTEYTTIDGKGRPITWPVTPYYRPGEPCIDVTTGIGYPKKANDARKNPKVALLFSDPTGCGLADPPAVLVQGTAAVDDEDLEANRKRYDREALEKLPGVKDLSPPEFLKKRLGFYYLRIYVHVRPERVYVWEKGDMTSEPQLFDSHMEEVRSGHDEEPESAPPAPEGGAIRWDERIEELGRRHETAVVSFVAPDGFPFAVRVPVRVDRDAGLVWIELGAARRAVRRRARVPDRPRPRRALHLATELPGPRRPHPGGGRLGDPAAQARRRLRASARLGDRKAARQPRQVAPFPPDGQAGAGKTGPLTTLFSQRAE